MISAWKKFISKSEIESQISSSRNNNGVPPGIQKLDKNLQRKFGRGVDYNMKIVIKGDARVGKTSLFLRLKGYGFDDNYTPTDNLNVTSINWNHKTADDIVKIDLWEAIASPNRRAINYVDLKLGDRTKPNLPSKETSPDVLPNLSVKETKTKDHSSISLTTPPSAVDPQTNIAKHSFSELSGNLDVYKGTDAVLLVLDMTKLWTFKYVQEEIPKVPKHIPVLVIANHRDQGHHRTVSAEQVKSFISRLERSPCDGCVMYTEASMKNGFGLRNIEKFFSIPFLKLQEASFLKQLELNRCEFMSTLEELEVLEELTNREYEQFLELQTIKRRQIADAQSPVNNHSLRKLDEGVREQIRNATVSSDNIVTSKNVRSVESNNNNELSDAQAIANQNFKNDRVASIVIGAKCPLENKTVQISSTQVKNQKASIDIENNTANVEASDESDDEEPRANPLVADYQSDLDSDDQMSAKIK